MSHAIDEYYSDYTEVCTKSDSARRCDACRETIPSGVAYWDIAITHGDPSSEDPDDRDEEEVTRCQRCQAIHLHLRELGKNSEMWPAEALDCGEDYEEHWEKQPPPEIAALAFLTAADDVEVSRG